MPGNAVSSLRGSTRAEKSWWAQGAGLRGGRQLGPRGFREPHSHRGSTAESSLGGGRYGCVHRISGVSFPQEGREQGLLCAHTPSPHTALSPRGSRLLPGESPVPFFPGAPWLGLRILLFRPCQFSLKGPSPKLATCSEPTGLLRTKVGLDARRRRPSRWRKSVRHFLRAGVEPAT